MNVVRFAVSVRHFVDYDPLEFCAFIEHWALSNNLKVRVMFQEILPGDPGSFGTEEMLIVNVEYGNLPTNSNYLIELKRLVKSASEVFNGIECIGITAA